MPGVSQVNGFDLVRVLSVVLLIAIVMAPLVFGRLPDPPAPPGPDGEDGRGKDPPEPPRPSGPPSNNIPLPDATQAGIRLREHGRLADRHRRPPRRPARHPDRRRVRTAPRSVV